MTKAPTPTEMSKGQSDNTNNATKSSIKRRLRTDLGRSVGVTTATQLRCLLNDFYDLSALIGYFSSVIIRRIIYNFLNVFPVAYITFAVSGKV